MTGRTNVSGPDDAVHPARLDGFGARATSLVTPLIGRESEIGAVGKALGRTRLLTLIGPGGVGKSRLAAEVVRRMARPPGMVRLVDLAAVPADWDVAAETARTLGLRSRGGAAATAALGRDLGGGDALLVLDNCDHVVDSCAELAAALLDRCDRLRIVATSRHPLVIRGEKVWDLDPLAARDAVRLFGERARLEEIDGEAVAALCDRLGRFPLAIELAAARATTMPFAEILTSLDASIGERRGKPSPVRSAVRWSQQLLDPTERRAFRRLAVFVGGFDAAAAAAVAPGLSVEGLTRLVDASLVGVASSGSGPPRYRLLETVREYAWELLADSGEAAAASSRHLHHYASLGHVEFASWPSVDADRLVADLEDDYANLRVAAAWAATADPGTGVQLLARTKDLFLRSGPADGLRLARPLLELSQARDRARVVVQITVGLSAMCLLGSRAAELDLVEARELSARLGDEALEAWARFFQGLAEVIDGAVAPARAHLEVARGRFQSLGLSVGEARSIAALALTSLVPADVEAAREAAIRLALEG